MDIRQRRCTILAWPMQRRWSETIASWEDSNVSKYLQIYFAKSILLNDGQFTHTLYRDGLFAALARMTHESSKIIHTNFMDRRQYPRELNHCDADARWSVEFNTREFNHAAVKSLKRHPIFDNSIISVETECYRSLKFLKTRHLSLAIFFPAFYDCIIPLIYLKKKKT